MLRYANIPVVLCVFGCGYHTVPQGDVQGPLEIYAEHRLTPQFRLYSWALSVSADSHASLESSNLKETRQRSFFIPANKLNKLRKSLTDHRFLDLPESVGRIVADGSKRILRMKTSMGVDKTVKIYFLGNSGPVSPEEEALMQRAASIWADVRGLFDDDDAVDSRQYEKDLLSKSLSR
jgi:hypothetical protein